MQPQDEEMTWTYRLLAMSVGSVSALLALGFSPPKTHAEGLVRFLAGCVTAFCFTGIGLRYFQLPINIDSVLAAGLCWGAIGWWVIGGAVRLGAEGTIFAAMSAWFKNRFGEKKKEDQP